ncbi:MAG: Smr/MutS family protein [Bacteroidales bacterium]|nr:Smr/MutS family protein [Bacteroidales bacterium]
MSSREDKRLESKLGFDRVRAAVAARCMTGYAVSRVEEEDFCTEPETIRRRLLLTDEMRLVLMFEEAFPTAGYIDSIPFLEPLLKDGSSIDATGLGKLRTILDTSRKIAAFFSNHSRPGTYPELEALSKGIACFPEIVRRIDLVVDKFGEIRDSASEELFSIRKSLRDKEGAISKRAAAILRQAQADGIAADDAAVAVRDGKFLIPVSTALKRRIQGFVYDESATGKTSFVEPAEIIELENDIVELRFDEAREIARILFEFSEFLRPYVPDLLESARVVGEIDFIMAKARVGADMTAGMPVISEDGRLNLRKARHPLLEQALKRDGKAIVPLSLSLSPGKSILLISGPNAGGKSVCLKTAGLLQYMFQWGLLIPTSESSELPVFERILVSIGDDQSLDNDLSTYSSFLTDMKEMLAKAGPDSLILIDEFGSGTEPAAGGAIAESILAELDRRGVYGVITTHYTNLKLYASGENTGVVNGAMTFDSEKLEPLFRMEPGLPGSSFAFELARKLDLPEQIVADAEKRAGRNYVDIERNLREIARGRQSLDEKLKKVRSADQSLEALTERYQKELDAIKEQRELILANAREEAERIVRAAGSKVEKTIREIRESGAEKQRTKAAREDLRGFVAALEKAKEKSEKVAKRPQEPLMVGEKIRIKEGGMVGEVIKTGAKNITVAVGNISTTISADRVERISSAEYRDAVRTSPTFVSRVDSNLTERKLRFSPEIDLRGQRLDEALTSVMHYIDDAIMLNMGSVRIIHGKGTGVLREEIQKYLRTIPGISSVADEDIRHGGTGVTTVTF